MIIFLHLIIYSNIIFHEAVQIGLDINFPNLVFNRFLFFVAWLSRCSLFKSCGASCLALSSVAGSQLCRRQSRKKGCCCHDRLGAVLVVSMVSSLRYGARRTVVSQEQRAQESAEATREKAVSWKIKPGDHPYRLHPRQPLEGCPSILVPLLSLCPSLCRDDRHPPPPQALIPPLSYSPHCRSRRLLACTFVWPAFPLFPVARQTPRGFCRSVLSLSCLLGIDPLYFLDPVSVLSRCSTSTQSFSDPPSFYPYPLAC